MTQQTHGTPELNYSKENFNAMYEALKLLEHPARSWSDGDPIKNAIFAALTKAEGKEV